jgi:hypothetical protein
MFDIIMQHSGMQQYTYAYKTRQHLQVASKLTLILLTWRIWWTPNNASKWQMGFNSAFKGLKENHDYSTQISWNKIK